MTCLSSSGKKRGPVPPSKTFGIIHPLTMNLKVFDFAENLFGKVSLRPRTGETAERELD